MAPTVSAPERKRHVGAWLLRALLVLVAAAGIGAGLKFVHFQTAGAINPETGALAPDEDADDAAAWAAILRDRNAEGRPCDFPPGAASSPILLGMSADGHPWAGAETPELVIEEFTDYRCPRCRTAHRKVRRLLSMFPDRIRIVYRHLPMDPTCNDTAEKPFHDRACELARIAVCAGRQGRFWEAHDFLLQNAEFVCGSKRCAAAVARRLDLDEDAFDCCMKNPATEAAVAGDLADARELGIRLTPTYRVAGRLYEKALPEEALASLTSPR